MRERERGENRGEERETVRERGENRGEERDSEREREAKIEGKRERQ